MKPNKIPFILLLTVFVWLTGCSSVKPWQRIYLNDYQMQMGGNAGSNFEDYVHSIRTGSVVAGSTKSSGGCGCN